MKILGIDFETTGLDCRSERVIEIGAVVWDVEQQKPLAMFSELVKPEGFSGLSSEITQITGIEDSSIKSYGVDSKQAFEKLINLATEVDYLVAHNAEFDKSFFRQECERLSLAFPETPWICTLQDVPYPAGVTTRKLDYLAAEHKVLNPFSHRALFDVLTMLNVLKPYDIKQVVERSKSPNVKVTAIVSFEEKDKAKNLGFRWDAKNKAWFKPFKECDIEGLQFPFEIRVESNATSPQL